MTPQRAARSPGTLGRVSPAATLVALVLLAPFAASLTRGESGSGRVARLGYLALHRPVGHAAPIWQGFLTRLGELGWAEGRSLVVEARDAGGSQARLDQLAAELVELKVDVVVASGTSAVLAAKRATRAIPIVIAGASDPVGFGLVSSLSRPGGNVTGVSDSAGREIEGKRLQLLQEVVPQARRIGVVLDSSGRRDPAPIQTAARILGLSLLVSLETTSPEEFRRTFAMMSRDGAQALYAPGTPVNAQHRDLIITLAAEHRLPAVYGSREFVEAGGLMSYGASYREIYERVATYVDRILRGTRPRDLPIEQPARLELVLNLKTAEALGLSIPRTVLVRADDVIR